MRRRARWRRLRLLRRRLCPIGASSSLAPRRVSFQLRRLMLRASFLLPQWARLWIRF